MTQIALIGDRSESVLAHRAIPLALERARAEGAPDISWRWIATRDLGNPAIELQDFSAVWAVPGSPYENTNGVLDAIRWARETRRPFLGTCGGFQHALLEFARNVLGLAEAAHAETHPEAALLIVTRLSCSLVEQNTRLHLKAGSQLRAIYGADSASEGYHCNYGPSPVYRAAFETAGLNFVAADDAGEPRAAELSAAQHPFFIGTLFQPERAALHDRPAPLVTAFACAAQSFTS
jgi:CTP synthase (UTP-ammonia lyase)